MTSLDTQATFTGLLPYVQRAAADRGVAPHVQAHVREVGHVIRVQRALAAASTARPGDQASLVAEAKKWRDALAAILDGVDAAIADVSTTLDLMTEDNHGPSDVRGPEPTGKRDDLRATPGRGTRGRA